MWWRWERGCLMKESQLTRTKTVCQLICSLKRQLKIQHGCLWCSSQFSIGDQQIHMMLQRRYLSNKSISKFKWLLFTKYNGTFNSTFFKEMPCYLFFSWSHVILVQQTWSPPLEHQGIKGITLDLFLLRHIVSSYTTCPSTCKDWKTIINHCLSEDLCLKICSWHQA